ncbi:MAG: kynureninase [Paracoccaceae bacterium]
MPTDFTTTRAMFDLPPGLIYLDGNSLGPLPRKAAQRVADCVKAEWGQMLITGWNKAGWMTQPAVLGDRLACLIGAEAGSVIVGDTLSIKIYQALASALAMRPQRRVILSNQENFPSDLYMAEGLCRSMGPNYELKMVTNDAVEDTLDETVAVLLLTEIDYRTGAKFNMAKLTQKAHEVGALTLWDLAHSAGALPVNLTKAKADFAVGCTYKYLNSGPGGPAFIYAAPHFGETLSPALAGWLGHAAPFDFTTNYVPAAGINRMRVGTPAVLQMAALEAALDVWDHVDMDDLRAASIALSNRFIAGVEATCPDLILASPRDGDLRGSQVSFYHAEGYAIMQALIARGVIGDFRAPNMIRFGFAPLYNSMDDIDGAIEILSQIMRKNLWDCGDYRTRAAVT